MTCYSGGKFRIGKKLAKIIYEESNDIEDEYEFTIKGYCEPFCGMLGVYQHIPDLFKENVSKLNYKAGDMNKSVIKMWQSAQTGWKPPTYITKEEFDRLKKQDVSSAVKGYVGHQYSYGGQYFEGYSPKYGKSKNSSVQSNRVSKIGSDLKNVTFKSGSYTQYSRLKGYVIYCDPPYPNTYYKHYHNGDGKKADFDHEEFWEWCRKMCDDNIVFVSSYTAPKDFENIYSNSHILTGANVGKKKKRVERLFLMY
jgi:DNA adenine methylase